ncbi:MAG: SH3 domain-containing protein [Chloroflexota bacterium]
MPVIVAIAAACQPTPVAVSLVDGTPTATLAPIVSLTPRLTATRVPTRTPRPTATPVPPTPTVSQTPTVTFTPTEVPPVIGVINSIQRVNVRTGPGFTYRDFDSVAPGTGVEIIGQSSDGNWLNVRLESGDEGWMAASLIRLQPTETPFPTFTPTTDETAIALGTEFPTAVVGSGTVTPTIPFVVAPDITPTPVFTPTGDAPAIAQAPTDENATEEITATERDADLNSTPVLFTNTPSPSPTNAPTLIGDPSRIPVIDIDAINATATALNISGAAAPISPTPTNSPTAAAEDRIVQIPTQPGDSTGPQIDTTALALELTAVASITVEAVALAGTEPATLEATNTVDADATAPPTLIPREANEDGSLVNEEAVIRNGVDVLAYCDDESFDAEAPTNLKAGSTVDVFWIWYAAERRFLNEHLENVIYDVRVNDNPIIDLNQYRQPIQDVGNDVAVSWYVPVGPLRAGEYTITYTVTWRNAVFDGYNFYGPGTNAASEVGSCTFTVYE